MRRKVNRLTLEDLEAYPIWEFADDEEDVEGQDETTVRPRDEPPTYDPRHLYLETVMVRTEFVSMSGAVYHGFCTPALDENINRMHPVIVTPHGHVGFYFGVLKPSRDELAALYERLGAMPETLFPIRFRSLIEMPGLVCSGTIQAFLRRTYDSPTLIEFT